MQELDDEIAACLSRQINRLIAFNARGSGRRLKNLRCFRWLKKLFYLTGDGAYQRFYAM
jgi:hypothetical protein